MSRSSEPAVSFPGVDNSRHVLHLGEGPGFPFAGGVALVDVHTVGLVGECRVIAGHAIEEYVIRYFALRDHCLRGMNGPIGREGP